MIRPILALKIIIISNNILIIIVFLAIDSNFIFLEQYKKTKKGSINREFVYKYKISDRKKNKNSVIISLILIISFIISFKTNKNKISIIEIFIKEDGI